MSKQLIDNELLEYVIFKTNMGYFGLLNSKKGLVRACISNVNYEQTKAYLLVGISRAIKNQNMLYGLQEKIKTYFIGRAADLSDVKVNISDLSDFTKRVLMELRKIKTGETISYGELANRSGSPKASRAVGNIMSNNPLPLIIPCHRVIKKNGELGNFLKNRSDGPKIKKYLLEIEKE